MPTTFLIRRGTSADWREVNPTLANGELGYDETTKMIKVGDGTTQWLDLPYQGGLSLPEGGVENQVLVLKSGVLAWGWRKFTSRFLVTVASGDRKISVAGGVPGYTAYYTLDGSTPTELSTSFVMTSQATDITELVNGQTYHLKVVAQAPESELSDVIDAGTVTPKTPPSNYEIMFMWVPQHNAVEIDASNTDITHLTMVSIGQGLSSSQGINLSAGQGGSLPSGTDSSSIYYVVFNLATNTYRLSISRTSMMSPITSPSTGVFPITYAPVSPKVTFSNIADSYAINCSGLMGDGTPRPIVFQVNGPGVMPGGLTAGVTYYYEYSPMAGGYMLNTDETSSIRIPYQDAGISPISFTLLGI